MSSLPRALRPGDRVVCVSPSGPIPAERASEAVAELASWDLDAVLAPHALVRTGYLAGADSLRAADLVAALTDPLVRGVFCLRGGYGAQRVVDTVPAALGSPRVVVGFSDITAVHLALWRRGRWATCHGAGSDWSGAVHPPGAAGMLRSLVMDAASLVLSRSDSEPTAAISVPGRASGVLLGGNLSLLETSIGTADFPDLAGVLLLLEDVGEEPYRVDRMLTHLRRSGALSSLAGVVVGQFTSCDGRDGTQSVVDVVGERVSDLGVPVLGGLPIGHGAGQRPVPLGVPASIDVAAGTLTASPMVS